MCRAASTGFPDSFAIRLYHPSLPPGLVNYILFPHWAVVNKFLLVVQDLHVRVMESIGESR